MKPAKMMAYERTRVSRVSPALRRNPRHPRPRSGGDRFEQGVSALPNKPTPKVPTEAAFQENRPAALTMKWDPEAHVKRYESYYRARYKGQLARLDRWEALVVKDEATPRGWWGRFRAKFRCGQQRRAIGKARRNIEAHIHQMRGDIRRIGELLAPKTATREQFMKLVRTSDLSEDAQARTLSALHGGDLFMLYRMLTGHLDHTISRHGDGGPRVVYERLYAERRFLALLWKADQLLALAPPTYLSH